MSEHEEELVTLREAAEQLGCGYSTLWSAVNSGRLPEIMGPGVTQRGRRAVLYVRLADARAVINPQPPRAYEDEGEYQRWYYRTYTKPRREAARTRRTVAS